MSEKDGGQAFPRNTMETIDGKNTGRFDGMTLLDYFAAQALNGFFSSAAWMAGMDKEAVKARQTMADAMAELAYQYADAMLKKRAK